MLCLYNEVGLDVVHKYILNIGAKPLSIGAHVVR